MANHCDGEAGKKSNLDRMLHAIHFAAGQGVQILAFPEMCLPGYFTRTAGTPAEAVKVNHALSDQVGRSRYLEQLQNAARENFAMTRREIVRSIAADLGLTQVRPTTCKATRFFSPRSRSGEWWRSSRPARKRGVTVGLIAEASAHAASGRSASVFSSSFLDSGSPGSDSIAAVRSCISTWV